MIITVRDIHKYFVIERGFLGQDKGMVKALEGVSFSIEQFDSLGIVGESGSGKTTLAKIISRLIPPTKGEVMVNADIIDNFRKDLQIIFQNPYNSLNPKMRIIDALAEPFIIHKLASKNLVRYKVEELLGKVGLEKDILHRYPIEFSGGQRQRICIARALATEPKLIILDEPIASLDLTVQAQMLDLFLELKKKFGLTYIFISHNLAVIKYIANRIIVMQDGKIVEQGQGRDIFGAPQHKYTKILLEAAKS